MVQPTPYRSPVTGDGRPASEGNSTIALVAATIAALYFGREIFVPLALAILLSFALAPLVSWLRRRHVPRIPAVIGVVLLAFAAISLFGMVVASQVTQLGANLPEYQANIEAKIRTLRANAGTGGVVEQASEMLRTLGEEIDGSAAPSDGPVTLDPADGEAREPIAVQILQPDPAPLELLQTLVGPLVAPLATGGIVIVFVIFMLLQREDLRDRFIRLVGSRDLHRTTQALSEAGKRVARYLLMQLIVNSTYGVPVGLGLWLIGIPNPLLWGMLAIILRFVPYIGPVIAALFPLALSIAVDPGWTMLLWTAGLFILLELGSNNIVEPWLYGSSTGLSPVAIIVAAIFWTWLWGPIGLLLSTPLTVCLVVLGRHVPQFAFLDVLLGSEPVLTPRESIYQRLLSGDPDEATDRAEEFLGSKPLLSFYDDVGLPVLAMFEQDRARGVLDESRRATVAAGVTTLVDNLSEHVDPVPDVPAGAAAVAGLPVPVVAGDVVICAGGRGDLDDAASAMLAQILSRQGFSPRLLPFTSMTPAELPSADFTGASIVCISYMNVGSLAHARYLVRRLRKRTAAPILIGFWAMEPGDRRIPDLVQTTRSDAAVTTLGSALEKIGALVQPSRAAVPAPA